MRRPTDQTFKLCAKAVLLARDELALVANVWEGVVHVYDMHGEVGHVTQQTCF